MLYLDAEIRGLLNNLRGFYVTKQEDFHLSLRGLSKEAKSSIIDLFESLYGVMSEIRYCADCDVINGKLIFSPRAQMFITGQYMEIAIRKAVQDVLTELEKKHQKQFKLYANTKVATVDGRLKNEFDLIIENVTDVNVMTEQEATSCYQSILTKRGTYTYNAEIAGTILELFSKIDGSKLSK